MNSLDVMYVLFSALVVFAALMMVFTRNVFRAAFYLLLCLTSIAAIYVLYTATYLAIVQLLVYAGGVVVLLSFGIMITKRSKSGTLESSHHLIGPGLIVFAGLGWVMWTIFRSADEIKVVGIEDKIQVIGQSFMTEYIVAFEVIAYLLLVVLVGSSLYAKSSEKE